VLGRLPDEVEALDLGGTGKTDLLQGEENGQVSFGELLDESGKTF
jgi:hypothetical protein